MTRQTFVIILAVLGILGLALFNASCASNPWTKALNATVAIECTNGRASGVIVGQHTVITAAHVAMYCQDMRVVVPDGTSWDVYAVKVDTVWDVARLRVKGEVDVPPVRRVGAEPKSGDRVCVVTGAPQRWIQCGRFTFKSDYAPGNLWHSAVTESGNSGSGLFNEKGELIGIVTHLITCTNGQSCGGRATYVQKVLDLWK